MIIIKLFYNTYNFIMSLVKRSWQKFCSVAAPQDYPFAMKIAHWGMGVGLIGGVLFVKKA